MPETLLIHGSPLIGLYVKANEDIAFIGIRDERARRTIEKELEVKVVRTTVSGSELVGAMMSLNSSGAVVGRYIKEKELNRIRREIDVLVVDIEINCMGNIIALNDRGAIIHPDIRDEVLWEIRDFLGVEVAKGTIGGVKTVGMSSAVTNNGALVNPNSTEWEMERIVEVLKVEPVKGTVNFGSEMVGTGVIANSRGYVAGRDTTGFELGVIEEALGFI